MLNSVFKHSKFVCNYSTFIQSSKMAVALLHCSGDSMNCGTAYHVSDNALFPLLVTRRRRTTAASSKRPISNWLKLTLPRSPGRPLLPPPRIALQRRRQWGMIARSHTCPTMCNDHRQRGEGAWRGWCSAPSRHARSLVTASKMALPLSREWILTTDLDDGVHRLITLD